MAFRHLLRAGAIMLALAVTTPASQAVPLPAGPVADTAASALATPVQYRGYYYGPRPYAYRPYYAGPRYRYRPFVGFGVGAAIVAGAIIANRAYAPRPGLYYDTYAYTGPYYYPSDYRGDPRVICARHFRSFEWNTGLYTTYQGDKRLCPYLRD